MALVQEKRATYCGVVAHIVRSLSHAMGLEMDALGPLLRNALPAPSNFQSFVHGCVENAVHPYCKVRSSSARRCTSSHQSSSCRRLSRSCLLPSSFERRASSRTHLRPSAGRPSGALTGKHPLWAGDG